MVGNKSALLTSLLLVAMAVSGCTSDNPAPSDNGEDTTPAGELASGEGEQFTAESKAAAPAWKVGNYFGHHVFLGADDTQGTHINTVVYEAGNSGYKLATDNKEIAQIEALFDVPILGDLELDLSTTSFGGPFPGYPFPLGDGDSWSGEITLEQDQFRNGITRDVDFTAAFNGAIKTPYGIKPGLDITGMSDGEVLVQTNFVPEIGWYSFFEYYNIDSSEPDDVLARVLSMGFGDNFDDDIGGVVFVYDSELKIDNLVPSPVSPDIPAEPPAHVSFAVDEGATHLFGIMYTYAVGGHGQVILLGPDGKDYGQMATGAPVQPAGDGDLYEFPLQIGGWEYGRAGVGIAGGGLKLWQLSEEQILF